MRLRLLTLAACTAAAVAAFPGTAAAKDCTGLPKHGNLPVVDAANIVPPEDEGYLVADLLAYRVRGKHAIVAVTVPTLGGDDVASYAQRMFDCWGIGDAQSDNGMLLLVALREQRIRIELGAGLEGKIGQPELDAALDDMVKPLRAGEIALAFRAAAEALVAEVGGTLPDSRRGDVGARPTATPTHPGDVSDPPVDGGGNGVPPLPTEIPYGVSPFGERRGPGIGFVLMLPLIFVLGIGSMIVKALVRGGLGAAGAGWAGGFSRFGGGGWGSASVLRGGSWHDDDSSSWSSGSDSGSSFGGGSSDSGSSYGGGSSGGGGASGSW